MTDGNGDQVQLPESRKAAVTQAAEFYQEEYQRNQELVAQVADLKTQLAGFKVTVDVLQAQVLDAESKTNSAMIHRDQHLAARIECEARLAAVKRLLDAPLVPSQEADRENQ